jgi:hypothetical protein
VLIENAGASPAEVAGVATVVGSAAGAAADGGGLTAWRSALSQISHVIPRLVWRGSASKS